MNTIQIPCTRYEIDADWYEGVDSSRIFLMLHGYNSNKAKHAALVKTVVARTSMSALVIEYSGHGESPFVLKDTRPAQHFLEVIFAFDWLQTTYPNAALSVIGSSYGSFLAMQLIKYRTPEKLILCAPAILQPSASSPVN